MFCVVPVCKVAKSTKWYDFDDDIVTVITTAELGHTARTTLSAMPKRQVFGIHLLYCGSIMVRGGEPEGCHCGDPMLSRRLPLAG